MGRFTIAIFFGLLIPTNLYGVTEPRSTPDTNQDYVMTETAQRAQTDLQMRRLMQLFSARSIDSEAFFERMQRIKDEQ